MTVDRGDIYQGTRSKHYAGHASTLGCQKVGTVRTCGIHIFEVVLVVVKKIKKARAVIGFL